MPGRRFRNIKILNVFFSICIANLLKEPLN